MIQWPFENKPPREVQSLALEKGYGKEGFAYFLRQRLGKTWLSYAEYTLLKEEGKVDWCVIICPNSLKGQWVADIEEVDPFSPICVYNSQQKAKTEYFFSKNKTGGVFIINYESVGAFLKNEGWKLFDTLRTYIVADESTKLKEPTKKMSKASLELASLCLYKRILTGKPHANSNADLWAQLKFINVTERLFHQHKYYFTLVGGYQGRQIVKNINTEILKKEMEPHCFIAEDKFIKGFEKIYEPMRFVSLKGDQKELYKKMEDELIFQITDDIKITAPIVLVQYLRLQQISSGIAGDTDGNQHNIVDPFENPRIDNVLEILESEIENKALIICRFKLSIKNLYKVLTHFGYKCLILQGNIKNDEIDEVKRKFNDEDYDILIAQIQVLSFGHTLCAQDDRPCDSVIFYENDFSLINRAQCESRPEKYERKKPISYYDLYASKMDKYIIQSLIRKEDSSMALMNYARNKGIFSDTPLKELFDTNGQDSN